LNAHGNAMTALQPDQIDAALRDLASQWLEIANGRASYGVGTAAEQSTRFQMERLLPLTARRCRLHLDPSIKSPVDALVSLVGMSPQTTIMMCEALQPRELMLVTSANARTSVEAIEAWLGDASRDWPRPAVSVELVPPTDSAITAAVVRNWVAMRRAAQPGARVVFDATGGKKSMSVIAGMLAVQLGLEVVYLDSTYDPSLRMPRPGSEVVVPIGIPG
jgi:hypothetical protein